MMVRVLVMNGVLGTVAVVLIATVVFVRVVVVAVSVVVMFVAVAVAPVMGVLRVRRGSGGWRGIGHCWLPFFTAE
jgi:hypothetical protein